MKVKLEEEAATKELIVPPTTRTCWARKLCTAAEKVHTKDSRRAEVYLESPPTATREARRGDETRALRVSQRDSRLPTP